MLGDICFMSFYLLIYLFFSILTSLRHYCNILFDALLIAVSYVDKHLT